MKKTFIYVFVAIIALSAILLAGCASPSTTTGTSQPLATAAMTNTPQPSATAATTNTPQPSTTAPPTATAQPSPTNSATPTTTNNETGRLEVRVTGNSATSNLTNIIITINGIEVKLEGDTPTSSSTPATTPATNENSWIALNLSGPTTFDLLDINGMEKVLIVGDLAPGQYNQIRMAVSKVLVAVPGEDFHTASIARNALTFMEPFDIVAGETTTILFDFGAANPIIFSDDGSTTFWPEIELNINGNQGALDMTTQELP